MRTFILTKEEKNEILIKHVNMGYKTGNILVENKIEAIEQAGLVTNVRNARGLKGVTLKMFDDVLKFSSALGGKQYLKYKPDPSNSPGLVKTITTIDELFDAVKNNKFATPTDAVRFQQGLLKSTSIPKPTADLIAQNIIGKNFIKRYSQYGTKKELRQALEQAGYSPNAVDSIVDAATKNQKFMAKSKISGGGGGKGGVGGGGGTKPVKTGDTPISKTKWFQYAKRAAIGGGVIFTLGYLFNLWLKSKGTAEDLPPCVKSTVPNVNTDPTIFERFLDTGYVLYDITPSKYRIYYNNKFELVDAGNSRVLKKGSWVFENNNLILTQDDGYVVTHPCGTSPVPPPNPGRLCPTYRYTSGPEFPVCSYNPSENLIRKVQKCLAQRANVSLLDDGYFGKKTQNALNALFTDRKFSNKFTTNDIPEICGESRLGPEYQQQDMMDPDQIEAAKKAEQQAKLKGGTGNQQTPDGPDVYRDATANPQSGGSQSNKQQPIMNKGFNMSGVERPYSQYLQQ